MNKNRLYWLCQIVGWSSWSIFEIFLYSAAQQFDLYQIIGELFQIFFNIVVTHLFREIIVRGGWLNFRWVKLVPRIVLGVLILSVANYFFLLGFIILIGENAEGGFTVFGFIAGIIAPSFTYFLWSIVYFTFHYFERYNKSLQYEAAINEFELNNLKSQLNPHFIFNALNSIRALVDENPQKSKDAITQLSNILRSSLILDKKRLITFSDELTTVKDYLDLELVRYEERLKVNYDIHPDSGDFNVPPMMVQTLVENGIKHGISKLKDGGEISIKTIVLDHTLVIQIRNSGEYKAPKINGREGFGLNNTIKRLDLIYGEEAKFEIGNEAENSVLTEIIIPETI
ncbi:MAG: histidine kinase [bacterium]|nr:histidine kinase [bacterium]